MHYVIGVLLVVDILLGVIIQGKLTVIEARLDDLEGPDDPIPDGEE